MLANKRICGLVLFCVANLAQAVGLGSITLYSYLNEPLSAEVRITDLDPSSVGTIQAELGSPKDFLKVNIERQTFLNDLNFEVVKVNNKLYIYIFSYENLKNPYLELLLKIHWKDGSLLKSYTLLVDPLTENFKAHNRPHAASEAIALEQRNFIEEKKIRIQSLMQEKEEPLNSKDNSFETVNTAQIKLNDNLLIEAAKSAELTGILTLSDASFEQLADQTNQALQKHDAIISPVNFDAEDELEKLQVKSFNPISTQFQIIQQNKLLPIKTAIIASSINLSHEQTFVNKPIINPMATANSNINPSPMANKISNPQFNAALQSEPQLATPLPQDFPLNLDEMMLPLTHVETDLQTTTTEHRVKEEVRVGAHEEHQLKEIQNHLEPAEYRSKMVSFIGIAILTISLISLLILIYRRYRHQREIDTDYAFSESPNNQEYESESLDEDLDTKFNNFDDEPQNNEHKSIDRKSIDADIENYQKQLDDMNSSLPVAAMSNHTIKSSRAEKFSETGAEVEQVAEIKMAPPERKVNPTASFDIAAARTGNSTGVEEIPAEDLSDSNMLVEIDPMVHYDLSAYEVDAQQQVHENINEPPAKALAIALPDIEYQQSDELIAISTPVAYAKESLEIIPTSEISMLPQVIATHEEVIEDLVSSVASNFEIKLADDDKPIQSINKYDTNIKNQDLYDLDLSFEDHNIESEGIAAFDNFDEANIKLDLAKQYYSAGYLDSAKEVINEIIEIGNTAQKDLALEILQKINEVEK